MPARPDSYTVPPPHQKRMSPLRIGVIGCGQIARAIHLPVLARIPDARLAALAEPVEPNRVAAAAMAPGARVFSDYRELLDAGGLDAAVICVPPHLHAPCAIAAFDAGLHVYLEKPWRRRQPMRRVSSTRGGARERSG